VGDVAAGSLPERRGPRRSRHRVLRRLAVRVPQYVLILWVAATANFALPRLMPGDPVLVLLGEDAARLPAETIAQELADVGLDQPLLTQYGRYMSGLAGGDLGYSFRHRQDVSTLLRQRLPWTILLVGTALLISTVLGVALAAFAVWRRGRRGDTASIALCTFLESTPPLWIGLLLLIWFGANLKWLPLFGSVSVDKTTGLERAGDIALHLVLPGTTTCSWLGPRDCGSAPSPSATRSPRHHCRSRPASCCGSVRWSGAR
jgi:peptide/nickel transport system permease protein